MIIQEVNAGSTVYVQAVLPKHPSEYKSVEAKLYTSSSNDVKYWYGEKKNYIPMTDGVVANSVFMVLSAADTEDMNGLLNLKITLDDTTVIEKKGVGKNGLNLKIV